MRRRFALRRGDPTGRGQRRRIPPMLVRANELLAAGEFSQAAVALEQVARGAAAGGSRHAARLYIEAGRALILSQQSARGMEMLAHGLTLMAQSRLPHRASRVAARLSNELRERGFEAEAERLSSFLDSTMPAMPTTEVAPEPARRPPLPTHCPECGAPVRPDEVEWVDNFTAECDYCGSPVRGE